MDVKNEGSVQSHQKLNEKGLGKNKNKLKESWLKFFSYSVFPNDPKNMDDQDKDFANYYSKKDAVFERWKDGFGGQEKGIEIIWNFSPEFIKISDQMKKLDWSEASNFNNVDKYCCLTNSKLFSFLGKMKQLEGTEEYENQIMGVIQIDKKIKGLVYLSNFTHVMVGTRFLTLSEISLFDTQDIKKVLPILIYKIHKELVPKYKNYIFLVDVHKENKDADLFLRVTEELEDDKIAFMKLMRINPKAYFNYQKL